MKMYKVVTGDLRSSHKTGRYSVQYKVGEFVYPELVRSKLFIFKNKKDAIEFSLMSGNSIEDDLTVYECECENVVEVKDFCDFYNDVDEIENFWATYNQDRKPRRMFMECYFADSVKLTNVVSTS